MFGKCLQCTFTCKVVDMLSVSKCHGTLLVPERPLAPWWPKLRRGSGWAEFNMEIVELPKCPETFLEGACPFHIFGGMVFPCDMYVMVFPCDMYVMVFPCDMYVMVFPCDMYVMVFPCDMYVLWLCTVRNFFC